MTCAASVLRDASLGLVRQLEGCVPAHRLNVSAQTTTTRRTSCAERATGPWMSRHVWSTAAFAAGPGDCSAAAFTGTAFAKACSGDATEVDTATVGLCYRWAWEWKVRGQADGLMGCTLPGVCECCRISF